MDLGLAGKRALVTGGTKGIGRAIVETLAAEGARVAFCARTAADVEAANAAIAGDVQGRAVDVGDGEALQAWIETAAAELGGLDIVVANVSALAGEPTEEHWRLGFEIDVLGTVRTINAALPHLEAGRDPAIVAVSSTAAVEVYAGVRPYTSVKAALIAYISSLSRELAPQGIRANTVSPGSIYFEGGVWHKAELHAPERYNDMLSRNPMGRMGRPDEIANAVVFLCSPRAGFTTGANLVCDGSLTQRIQY